jgi:short-subunit dehydrogenase involved in D-alanine esterification of teichoic acids
MDEYDNKREEVVDAIIKQFTNLDTLYNAINIMRNEDLTSTEARFEKLGGILTL